MIKFVYISRIILNKKQAQQYLQRKTIFIADIDHDYILYAIIRHDKIEYERQIYNDGIS